jgi:hypothetical protein
VVQAWADVHVFLLITQTDNGSTVLRKPHFFTSGAFRERREWGAEIRGRTAMR